MQYIDPYLFYAYELRKYSLEAKLIITIGYGYYDEHINGIIGQALRHDKDTKLIAVLYRDDGKNDDSIKNNIIDRLNYREDNQLIIEHKKASDFLKEDLNLKYLNEYATVKGVIG